MSSTIDKTVPYLVRRDTAVLTPGFEPRLSVGSARGEDARVAAAHLALHYALERALLQDAEELDLQRPTSLPVPLSPVRSTVASLCSRFSMSLKT